MLLVDEFLLQSYLFEFQRLLYNKCGLKHTLVPVVCAVLLQIINKLHRIFGILTERLWECVLWQHIYQAIGISSARR